MKHVHAAVWLDHLKSNIVGFSLDRTDKVSIESENADRKIHRKSGVPGSGHAAEDHKFFDEIAQHLLEVRSVVITGPGNSKIAFEKYMRKSHPKVAEKIVGVETLDHPTPGELLAYARKYFDRLDKLGTI